MIDANWVRKEKLEELREVVVLKAPEKIKDEMGDVLFFLVNLSRFLDISAEDALRMTIAKFENWQCNHSILIS